MTDRSLPAVHLHIGGDARNSGSGGTHSHIYPVDGSSTGPIPLAGADEANLANGDTVTATQSAVVLENLISQFLYSKAAEGTSPATEDAK